MKTVEVKARYRKVVDGKPVSDKTGKPVYEVATKQVPIAEAINEIAKASGSVEQALADWKHGYIVRIQAQMRPGRGASPERKAVLDALKVAKTKGLDKAGMLRLIKDALGA